MIARVLDLPDDEARLAAWLDEQIVAPQLHELVAELAAVQGMAGRPRSATPERVMSWLGDARPGVLDRGTAALDGRRRAELLRDPGLLPALQEIVFIEGGGHWQRLAGRAGSPPSFSAADVLRRSAAGPTRGDTVRPAASVTPAFDAVGRPGLPRLVVALAAALLVAVAGWSLLQPGPAGAPWGWNRPAAFAAAAAPDYLEQLAAAADEWSAVTPATEAALADRLQGMLAGCDRLLAAAHEPLAPADRDWLRERCNVWREKFAGQLATLGASHDPAAVRREADATVAKLVAALRTRAAEVRTRGPAA